MARKADDFELIDRLISGDVTPQSAPRGLGDVASLMNAAASAPDEQADATRTAETLSAMSSSLQVSQSHALRGTWRRSALRFGSWRRTSTRLKLGAAGMIGAMSLTSGLAFADVL